MSSRLLPAEGRGPISELLRRWMGASLPSPGRQIEWALCDLGRPEMADDLLLPEIELFHIVIERRQGQVFEPGPGQFGDARADLRRGAEQVAGAHMAEGDAAGRPADLLEAPLDLRPIGDHAVGRPGGARQPAIGMTADAFEDA